MSGRHRRRMHHDQKVAVWGIWALLALMVIGFFVLAGPGWGGE